MVSELMNAERRFTCFKRIHEGKLGLKNLGVEFALGSLNAPRLSSKADIFVIKDGLFKFGWRAHQPPPFFSILFKIRPLLLVMQGFQPVRRKSVIVKLYVHACLTALLIIFRAHDAVICDPKIFCCLRPFFEFLKGGLCNIRTGFV